MEKISHKWRVMEGSAETASVAVEDGQVFLLGDGGGVFEFRLCVSCAS